MDYTLVDENITGVTSITYPAYDGSNKAYTNLTELHGYCRSMIAAFSWKADEYTGIIESTSFIRTYKKNCTEPDTEFPIKASNQQVLFQWQNPEDRSDECTQLSGKIETSVQSCKTEYRCVKDTNEICPRDEYISSYVSPTARTFNEDIALMGTDITLHYKSDNLNDNTIASGWSLNVHNSLDGDNLHLGSGKLLDVASSMSQDNNITTVTINNKTYIFDANSLHILTKDSFTKQTIYTFAYNANNKLVSITDAFGMVTTINRDATGSITSITAPHGQINYLDIDANGDLVAVSYEDNSKYEFTYIKHLMTSETEPNGNNFIHQFDENGKVVKVIDAEDGQWKFSNSSHDSYFETLINRAAGDTVIYKDYFLNGDSLISEMITPSGDILSGSSKVDASQSTFNRCGVKTSINYDTTKDIITNENNIKSKIIQMPSGLSKNINYSQTYMFDTNNTLVKKESITEINGASTIAVRDYNLSTATITSPEGRVTTIEYDKDTNLPTKLQVANLKPIIYKYDKEGRVKKIKQGPRRVKYVYDDRGNVAQEINLQRKTTTSYEYDQKDKIIKTTYPDGSTVEFSYDKNGNRVRLTTPTPTDHTFEYNGVNKRVSMTSPLGYKTLYTYDKQRRVTDITRASGKTIHSTYVNGELQSLTTPEGTSTYTYTCGSKISSVTNNAEKIDYTYDGELLTQIKAQGILNQNINYIYNRDFRVTSLAYADATTNYSYDKDGYLTSSAKFILKRDKKMVHLKVSPMEFLNKSTNTISMENLKR